MSTLGLIRCERTEHTCSPRGGGVGLAMTETKVHRQAPCASRDTGNRLAEVLELAPLVMASTRLSQRCRLRGIREARVLPVTSQEPDKNRGVRFSYSPRTRRYATDGEVGLAVNQVLRLREFESLYLHEPGVRTVPDFPALLVHLNSQST